MEKNNKTLNVPNLRFPEFSGEWEKTRFENVVSLQRGSSPRPIIEYITKSSDGVNWVKIGDMPKYGRLVTSTEEKITKEGAKKSRRVNVGDLILSNSMSYGQPYIMNIDGYIHDGWFVLKNFEKSFDRDYLCNLLISPAVQNQYRRLAAGGVVQNISSDLVNSVIISLPSIKEQQKIASVLNIIDDRIATQRKVIEKYESLIRGLCENLTRQGTANKTIDECLECHSSTLQESAVLDVGRYPVYGATGVCGYTDAPEASGDGILIIKDGASVGVTYFANGSYSSIGTLNRLTAKEGINLRYAYYCLKVMNFAPFKTGLAIPHIYFKDYGKHKIWCPPLEQQSRIADALTNIDNMIHIEKSLLEQLNSQKRYVLNQLFI
ncbi:MAG: restriction endonuclease subunit S [Bacteroidales bacterium]|nr:restriction endonuclease subunit S [Bacteroidales bacterium]